MSQCGACEKSQIFDLCALIAAGGGIDDYAHESCASRAIHGTQLLVEYFHTREQYISVASWYIFDFERRLTASFSPPLLQGIVREVVHFEMVTSGPL